MMRMNTTMLSAVEDQKYKRQQQRKFELLKQLECEDESKWVVDTPCMAKMKSTLQMIGAQISLQYTDFGK